MTMCTQIGGDCAMMEFVTSQPMLNYYCMINPTVKSDSSDVISVKIIIFKLKGHSNSCLSNTLSTGTECLVH